MARKQSVTKRPAHWHWYHTNVWRDMRRRTLLRYPNCVYCLENGKHTEATIVDHIVPHKGQWGMFANMSNLQALCASCHSGPKRRIDMMHRRTDRQMDKYKVGFDGWIVRRKCT